MKASSALATSLSYSWRLQRSDGIGVAIISHDRGATIEGQEFRGEPDLRPLELTLARDMLSSGLSLEGAFSPSLLSQDDLSHGRWIGASVALSMTDWQTATEKLLCRGRLGKIVAKGATFSGEVDVLPRNLRQAVCPQTSPECRAQLGDELCQVAMRKRTRRVTVATAANRTVTCETDVSNEFAFGELRWLTGANCGIDQSIVAIEEGAIVLLNTPPMPVVAGDRALIREGCDGRLSTCAERFNNVANFRGEPQLPGTDVLLRYPGA